MGVVHRIVEGQVAAGKLEAGPTRKDLPRVQSVVQAVAQKDHFVEPEVVGIVLVEVTTFQP